MLSQEKIDKLKRQYGELYLVRYENEVFNQDFVFRLLSLKEYKEISEAELPQDQFQEMICKTAVLYPENYDFSSGPAGVAEFLCNNIIEKSDLIPERITELMKQYREEMYDLDYQIDAIIHEAFPHYSLEEIESWTVRKKLKYLSRAEWILVNLKGIPLMEVPTYEAVGQYHAENQPQNTINPTDEPNEQEQKIDPSERRELSKEEVEALLSTQLGRPVNLDKEESSLNDKFPELNWFKHVEELTGDFD